MKKLCLLTQILIGVLILVGASNVLAEEAAAEPLTLEQLLQPEKTVIPAHEIDALFAPENKGCTFCNPSGYLVCQNAHGTSCGLEGQFRRCIVAPVCYCEWGGCRCQGGVWNCVY